MNWTDVVQAAAAVAGIVVTVGIWLWDKRRRQMKRHSVALTLAESGLRFAGIVRELSPIQVRLMFLIHRRCRDHGLLDGLFPPNNPNNTDAGSKGVGKAMSRLKETSLAEAVGESVDSLRLHGRNLVRLGLVEYGCQEHEWHDSDRSLYITDLGTALIEGCQTLQVPR